MRELCDPLEFTEEILEDIETEIETLGPAKIPNPLNLPHQCFVSDEHKVSLRVNYKYLYDTISQNKIPPTLELAGPRPYIYFDPSKVKAGIVTCGGLCPGINDVIRSIVMT
ncbi:MAG: ATP-dependent 6-phosphofructokinase, partial [Caldimicrobium sp.]